MKLTRPILVIAALAAVVLSTRAAYAGSGCPDDPERCVERGASTSHRTVAVAPTTVATTANVPARGTSMSTAAHKPAATNTAPAHRSSSKPARISPATPAPATPGMGMLLKLSNGSAGEVSLFPTKPNEKTEKTTETSWVL